jgi:Mycothiol maleylpyruvate isomerase N-terminal domain
VPACPAWTVRDVVGHLTAIPEDAAAAQLRGIPTDEVTAGQVARLADLPAADVLARWGVPMADGAAQPRPARGAWLVGGSGGSAGSPRRLRSAERDVIE